MLVHQLANLCHPRPACHVGSEDVYDYLRFTRFETENMMEDHKANVVTVDGFFESRQAVDFGRLQRLFFTLLKIVFVDLKMVLETRPIVRRDNFLRALPIARCWEGPCALKRHRRGSFSVTAVR